MALKPAHAKNRCRTWTREQKDRWWFDQVFRGSMPQLTLRSALTGFVLGMLLSATNLYVGCQDRLDARVGLTSVILAFAIYRAFSRARARRLTILENKLRAVHRDRGRLHDHAGSPRAIAAYMWPTNKCCAVADHLLHDRAVALGVLVAFPMKRRFINDEQHPFPEGRACAWCSTPCMRRGRPRVACSRPRALALAAGLAGGVEPDLRRALHAALAGTLARSCIFLAPAAPARRLVLLARRARARAYSEAGRRGRAPASRCRPVWTSP